MRSKFGAGARGTLAIAARGGGPRCGAGRSPQRATVDWARAQELDDAATKLPVMASGARSTRSGSGRARPLPTSTASTAQEEEIVVEVREDTPPLDVVGGAIPVVAVAGVVVVGVVVEELGRVVVVDAGGVEVLVLGLVVVVAGAVVVVELGTVVVVEPCGESGETQSAGGAVGPLWPGMSTVPAHPKLLKSPCTVTDPPSENW